MGPALQQIFCRAGPVCPAEGAVRNGGQENPAPTDRLMVRWDGPMWASAPTERLSIESHIALHGRRSGFHCLDGQHKRGARRGCRRRGDAKARNEICLFPFARRKRTDAGSAPPAERIPKPWFWRRSFLPFFRCRKKGSRRRQRRYRQAYGLGFTDCHTSDVGHWFALTGLFTWSAVVARAAGCGQPALRSYTMER